jgi:RHS repeat-associated protein
MVNLIPQIFTRPFSYDPFGMITFGRSWEVGSGYRYAFNGMEGDDEIVGNDNALDFGARVYDARLGRFFSVDPAYKNFAYFSVYGYAFNNSITLVDYGGLKGTIYIQVMLNENGEPAVNKTEMAKLKKQLENYYRTQHNVDIKIEVNFSNDLFTLAEFKLREDYDETDSYIIIGSGVEFEKKEDNNELEGWSEIANTSDIAGRAGANQFYAFINITNVQGYYGEKGFKNWTDFLFKTVIHESSHPKFKHHPGNRTGSGMFSDWPNEKTYVDAPHGSSGHVEETVMDDSNNDINLDNYMISLLQMLHGQVTAKKNEWESGTIETQSGEVITNRDLIARDIGLVANSRTDNK